MDIPKVCDIWLPIVTYPELCEECSCYEPNDDVDRECDLQNLCYEVEKLEVKCLKKRS